MDIQAKGLDYRALNEAIRAAGPSCRITGYLGQRFIGAGMSGRRVEIDGIPGNALGAYLGTARRARDFQRRCIRHPHPGSGDAPSPHGGGDRPSAAAGGALVRPVRRRRGSIDGRAFHRGDAGQQKPVPADVRGQLTFLIIFMRRCAGGAEHAEVRTDLRGQSKKSIQNR